MRQWGRALGACLAALAAGWGCEDATGPDIGSGSTANAPPTIASMSVEPGAVATGGSAAVKVVATDPNGDGVVFAFSADHGQLQLDGSVLGRAQYRHDGSQSASDVIRVTVTDSKGAATRAERELRILRSTPGGNVTRAEMAVLLLTSKDGAAYQPPPCAEPRPFGDVPCSHWAAAWIGELERRGISGGCGDGNYCPDSDVTRAQMAVFLLATAGIKPGGCNDALGAFEDVPCDYWAARWIYELVARGIAGGCASDQYCPEASVSHSDMAVHLERTFGG